MIKPADQPILQALYAYRYISYDQLHRLLYAQGSKTYPYTRVMPLFKKGYVLRKKVYQREGAPYWLYTLSGKGLAYLEQLGYPMPYRYRPNEATDKDLNRPG